MTFILMLVQAIFVFFLRLWYNNLRLVQQRTREDELHRQRQSDFSAQVVGSEFEADSWSETGIYFSEVESTKDDKHTEADNSSAPGHVEFEVESDRHSSHGDACDYLDCAHRSPNFVEANDETPKSNQMEQEKRRKPPKQLISC